MCIHECYKHFVEDEGGRGREEGREEGRKEGRKEGRGRELYIHSFINL